MTKLFSRTVLLTTLTWVAFVAYAQESWINPMVKQGRLGSPLVEVSPFVFDNKLYLLENNQRFWDLSDGEPGDNFHEDAVWIRDVASGELVSTALTNHGFGTVLVWNDRVYIFAGNYGRGKPWRQMTSITMTSSSDLKNWTEPVTMLEADPGEFIYNTAICRAGDQFVMLYETNDAQWPAFTFKYLTSSDMVKWDLVPDGIYGRDKYVGGPALYYEAGWYYTLYLQVVNGGFETRITRSKDLVDWQDAPEDRPFVTFDPSHQNIPLLHPDVRENNASDVELCYFNGQTILYFTGSDQTTAGDLQWATYDGTPRMLFEHFFQGVDPHESTVFVPTADIDWLAKSANTVAAEVKTTVGGTPVYSPGGYGGNVWSRDYYYIVSGLSDAVPATEIKAVVELFLTKQLPDGRVPKNVNDNLEADYVCWNMEGAPTDRNRSIINGWSTEMHAANPAARRPEADAAQFLVLLADEYMRRSSDIMFAKEVVQPLHRAMQSIPRSRNGLVWINPKKPHTSYGFTDGIVKTGNELYCSLLFWQASNLLAEMAYKAGDEKLKAYYKGEAKKIEQNIDVLWDAKRNAFLAATESCRQIDIWGNAYAVWINFPLGDKLDKMQRFLADNFDQYVYKGQVRHLLEGEYWEHSISWPDNAPIIKDSFQNGAYWGTAAGWVAFALAEQSPHLTKRLFSDLISFYREEGVYECVGQNNYKKALNYGASATLPLLAIKRLQPQRSSTSSDTTPPEHGGDWAPVLIAPKDQQLSGNRPSSSGVGHPTPQQLDYQKRQLGAFIHFGPATYIHSNMMSVPDVSIFDPTQLDADQWVRTAVSFGAKHVVLTAKHHNGFCLWPTKTTDYSVKNAPWRDGQGDVVAEFVAACRKYGVKPGLYISSGDKYLGCTSTPDPLGERKLVGDIDWYFPLFLEQVRELLTDYGQIDYVWFDGAYDPFGWDVAHPDTGMPLGTAYGDAIRAMIRNLQPQALVFGGTRPDVRWSGSEQGWAPYPLWNVVGEGEQLQNWVGPENTGWIPAEANIHPRSTWFWTPESDNTLRDVSFLEEVYFQSIGRGANLLINLSPDTAGRIPPAEVARLNAFGEHLTRLFAAPLVVENYPQADETGYIEIPLPKKKVRMVELVEDIEHGQVVTSYSIEGLTNNKWSTLSEGQSIGRRRLERYDALPIDRLRIKLKGESVVQSAIKCIKVY